MLLIVGLGNPGKEYENTYHNMGFNVLDEFCNKYDIKISKNKQKALIYEGVVLGEKVVLAKPQTYMNLSGEAVVLLKNKFKPDKILVVYDDIDVPQGNVRFRNSGSAGTHNGMKSIVSLLGSQEFARIRVGIMPKQKQQNLANYVLSKVGKDSLENISLSYQKSIKLLEEFIKNKGCLENKSI